MPFFQSDFFTYYPAELNPDGTPRLREKATPNPGVMFRPDFGPLPTAFRDGIFEQRLLDENNSVYSYVSGGTERTVRMNYCGLFCTVPTGEVGKYKHGLYAAGDISQSPYISPSYEGVLTQFGGTWYVYEYQVTEGYNCGSLCSAECGGISTQGIGGQIDPTATQAEKNQKFKRVMQILFSTAVSRDGTTPTGCAFEK